MLMLKLLFKRIINVNIDLEFFITFLFLNAGFLLLYFSQIITQNGIVLDEKILFRILGYGATLISEVFVVSVLLSKKKKCQKVIIYISAAFFILDFYSIFYYNTVFNYALFEIILATNFNEAFEFLSVHFDYKIFILIVFIFCVIKFVGHKINQGVYIQKNKKLLNIIMLFNLLLTVCMWGGITYKNPNNLFWLTNCISLERMVTLPLNAYIETIQYDNYKKMYGNKDIEIQNNANIPYIVFVLGESMNRNHMQLYGYHLNNNPNLSKKEKNLFVFNDVISPQSGTLQVLKVLFSFYNGDGKDNFYNNENLFFVLRKSGYSTTWISNQDNNNISSNLGLLYAEVCDRFYFTQDFFDELNYDGKILPLIDQAIKSEENKYNFYVIHLMGAHEEYAKRYPDTFKKFDLNDEKSFDGSMISKKVRSDYDNAVLYNDYIVNAIIEKFINKNAMIIYVSDHGEEVYEDRAFSGHYPNGNFNMIEIPMIIYVTNEFKLKFPELVNKIKMSVNKPFVTNDMIHSLLDIMNIDNKNLVKERSIFNEKFNITSKRIYNGQIYTKEWRN